MMITRAIRLKKRLSAASVLLSASLVCSSFLVPANADTITVYKSVGEYGEVKFSQFPPRNTKKVDVIELRSTGGKVDTGRMAGKTNNSDTESDVLRQKQHIEEQLKDNAQRCQSLRNNLNSLNSGGRIYELDANGARKYLNNREIELKRENFEKLISQYCTGQSI